MNFLLRCLFVIICLCLMLSASAFIDAEDEGCTTDIECMAFCPPLADDSECDGGPQ